MIRFLGDGARMGGCIFWLLVLDGGMACGVKV